MRGCLKRRKNSRASGCSRGRRLQSGGCGSRRHDGKRRAGNRGDNARTVLVHYLCKTTTGLHIGRKCLLIFLLDVLEVFVQRLDGRIICCAGEKPPDGVPLQPCSGRRCARDGFICAFYYRAAQKLQEGKVLLSGAACRIGRCVRSLCPNRVRPQHGVALRCGGAGGPADIRRQIVLPAGESPGYPAGGLRCPEVSRPGNVLSDTGCYRIDKCILFDFWIASCRLSNGGLCAFPNRLDLFFGWVCGTVYPSSQIIKFF